MLYSYFTRFQANVQDLFNTCRETDVPPTSMCFGFAKHGRPKVPMRKLSPSQGQKTEVHAPGFLEFAKQILLNGAQMCAFYGDTMNFSSSVCGIVAEYNPFHSGHMFHIRRTRESLGGDAVIVCAMSGNFVQRGDFALLDKYARAEMAVRGGADLVLELPLAAALSSAEGFAQGAVALLHKIGCDTLSFGAENADISLFLQAADALDRKSTRLNSSH